MNDDMYWGHDYIMTAEKVKASRLHGSVRALQTKCCFPSVVVPVQMQAVVTIAVRSLYLERQVTKLEQILVEAERKYKMLAAQSSVVGSS